MKMEGVLLLSCPDTVYASLKTKWVFFLRFLALGTEMFTGQELY